MLVRVLASKECQPYLAAMRERNVVGLGCIGKFNDDVYVYVHASTQAAGFSLDRPG